MVTAAWPVLLAAAPPGPLDISRDDAQRQALDELRDPKYHVDDPSLWERLVRWIVDELSDLLDRLVSATPGGPVGLTIVVLVAIGLAIALWFGARAALRARGEADGVVGLFDDDRPLTAAEHRMRAQRAEQEQRFADAVRERVRAIVRGLEERGLLVGRPGRTADEAAAEIGDALPSVRERIRHAAVVFDSVTYGEHPASAGDAAELAQLDAELQSIRLADVAPSAGAQ